MKSILIDILIFTAFGLFTGLVEGYKFFKSYDPGWYHMVRHGITIAFVSLYLNRRNYKPDWKIIISMLLIFLGAFEAGYSQFSFRGMYEYTLPGFKIPTFGWWHYIPGILGFAYLIKFLKKNNWGKSWL